MKKPPTQQLRNYGAICAVVSLFWVAAYWVSESTVSSEYVSPLLAFELHSQDFRVRHGSPAPVDPRIVYLGFDQQVEDRPFEEEIAQSTTLQHMTKNWPWSREVWADAIERLTGAGAKLVIVDLLFPNPGVGDEKLQQVLYTHADRTILGYNIGTANAGHESVIKTIYPSETIIDSVSRARPLLAYVNFYPDADDVIRRVTFQQIDITLGQSGNEVNALSSLAVIKSGWDQKLPRDFQQNRFRYAGPPNRGFPYRPIYEIFVPTVWENNYQNGAFFKDKIVLIGPAANWTQDLQKTPYLSPMFGPEVHANAINAALTGSFIHELDPRWNVVLISGMGLLCFLIMNWMGQPIHRIVCLALWNISYLVIIQGLYNTHGWMLIALAPLLCLNTSGAGCLLQQFISDRLEKARTRANFEKYVSANVVQSMLDRSEEFEEIRQGRRLPCTVLFSDLRGFTTITEIADSKELVIQLNEYFSEMVESVFRHDGTLDKFIGDAVMAVWGNVSSAGIRADARHAVLSALDMLDSLEKLNQRWTSEGKGEFHIGIGINHGEVIAADMGSAKKKEFTVIGDAVNLASRLEGVTKNYELPLILGESVAELVREHFTLQSVDWIQVKGRSKPVDTFTVLQGEVDRAALASYESAIKDYRTGRFQEAGQTLERLVPTWRHNELPQIYLERCRDMLAHPPQNWDGIFVMQTK